MNYKIKNNLNCKIFKLPKFLDNCWGAFLAVFIICTVTFQSYSELYFLVPISFGFLLGISILCIIFRYYVDLNFCIMSMLVFCATNILGMFYTPSLNSAWIQLYMYLLVYAMLFCISNYIISENKFLFVAKVLMYSGVTLSVYSVITYGEEFFSLLQQNERYAYFRFGSELGNANVIGCAIAFGSVIALLFMFDPNENAVNKIIDFAVFVFNAFFAVLTASKKAIIILVVGALMTLFVSKRNDKNLVRKIVTISICIILIFVAIHYMRNLDVFKSVNKRIDSALSYIISGKSQGASDQERSYLISEGLSHFREKPILGNGTDSSMYFFGKYTHCNFVEILLNFGLVGFAVYYVGIFVVFTKLFVKYMKDSDNVCIRMAFVLITLILIIDVGLIYYSNRFYNIIIAMAISAAYMKNNEKQ